MSSKAAASLSFDEVVQVLADEDVRTLSFKDGTHIHVRKITSINQTAREVRIIPHGGRPQVFPISDISEIIVA